MLGVAILLGLALWFIIVCLATFLPLILIKNKRAACIIAFIGFMLTFGGWWIKWFIEGQRTYWAGVEACKQAKLTIYVQPEKWIEMVGGHKAWQELADSEEKEMSELSEKEKQTYPATFTFKGIKYDFHYITHKRVLVYGTDHYAFNDYTSLDSYLYYDWETKTVLYTYTWFSGNGYSIVNVAGVSLSNLLGIRNGHKECNPENELEIYKKYFYWK